MFYWSDNFNGKAADLNENNKKTRRLPFAIDRLFSD